MQGVEGGAEEHVKVRPQIPFRGTHDMSTADPCHVATRPPYVSLYHLSGTCSCSSC